MAQKSPFLLRLSLATLPFEKQALWTASLAKILLHLCTDPAPKTALADAEITLEAWGR